MKHRDDYSIATQRMVTCCEQEKGGATNGAHDCERDSEFPKRVRGSEVFVGGLQRKTTEDTLREIFSRCGDIAELRIMKDSNGVSKGYAFVRFTTKEAAQRAQKEKNGTLIQGKKIGVTPSADQDTLFLGNLRKEWGRQELENMVMEAFHNVHSVELAMPPSTGDSPRNKKQQNRGFAFVHFATHAAAARAFRAASKPEFMLGGKWRPAVDWAENEPDPDPEEMSKVKTAFVGNLPSTVKEDFLRKLFEPYGKIERVAVSRKGNSPVGFVHFMHRSHVEAAIQALHGQSVSGPDRGPSFKLQVSLAKPVDKSRKRSHDEYQSQNGGILPLGTPNKTAPGALGVYGPGGGAYGDYTDYVVAKNPLVENPYGFSVYTLPESASNHLQHIFRAGAAMGFEKDKAGGDGVGRTKGMEYGTQGPRRDGLSALGPNPSSRLAVLDGYNSIALAHASANGDHRGYDGFGNYSPNSLASVTPGLLGGQPLLSRVISEPHGLSSFRNSPSIAAGDTGPGESNGANRRAFKFDPYTGEPYKFDPFTGEPLQSGSMTSGPPSKGVAALSSPNLVPPHCISSTGNRVAGKYY